MLNGTFATLRSVINGRCRLFSLVILATSLVVTSSVSAKSHRSDRSDSDSSCCCSKSKKGPRGDIGLPGPSGDDSFGGLDSYASFQLIQSGSTVNILPNDAIPFGKIVAGSVGDDTPIEVTAADFSTFTLETGTYKIAAGVSTFATPGVQVQVSLNGAALYNWPLRPTNNTNASTTFIELTFILEVTEPQSILQFTSTVNIPATPVGENTLQNYLAIEKIS